MAFHSYAGSATDDLARVWVQARNIAGNVWQNAQALRTTVNADTTADKILSFGQLLSNARTQLALLAAVPGIGQYAKDQIQNQTYDVAVEFSQMLAAIDAVISWISTNTPKDGNGKLLIASFSSGSVNLEYISVPAASLAGLRSALSALILAID